MPGKLRMRRELVSLRASMILPPPGRNMTSWMAVGNGRVLMTFRLAASNPVSANSAHKLTSLYKAALTLLNPQQHIDSIVSLTAWPPV